MRYIDADVLIDDLIHNRSFYPAMVASAIKNTPTAEVVEVVRCKDCKYVLDHGMAGLWCEHPDNRNPCGCRPNDFCNDGERREG